MRARVKWVEAVTFVAESGSGHALVMDGAAEAGGRNLGIRPMEALLMGLGACSAFDVVTILGKARADITDCVVELEAERAETIPSVFTRVHLHYVVTGRALKPAVVERAVKLSAEKYCSATAMFEKTATVSFDLEIRESP